MKNVKSLREFAKAAGFSRISKVRVNKNGFKFVTLMKLDKDGVAIADGAENVYFSKTLSSELEAGHALSKADLDDLRTATVANATGEERTKIIGAGGDYQEI